MPQACRLATEQRERACVRARVCGCKRKAHGASVLDVCQAASSRRLEQCGLYLNFDVWSPLQDIGALQSAHQQQLAALEEEVEALRSSNAALQVEAEEATSVLLDKTHTLQKMEKQIKVVIQQALVKDKTQVLQLFSFLETPIHLHLPYIYITHPLHLHTKIHIDVDIKE